MTDQYLSRTIQRATKPKEYRPGPVPTFQGKFIPEMIEDLKAALRAQELAQLKAVQPYREVCRSADSRKVGRLNNDIQGQIDRAREIARKKESAT